MNKALLSNLLSGVVGCVVGIVVWSFILFPTPSAPSQYGSSNAHTIGGDLIVNGNSTTTGNSVISGTLAVTGATTLTGAVTTIGGVVDPTGSIGSAVSSTMATATTTALAIQNTSGRTRVLTSIVALFGVSSNNGTTLLNAGTSTDAFTTSTSPLIATILTKTAGRDDVLTTTSTLQSAYAPWRNNDWIVIRTTTSTNSGVVYVNFN